jgi:hypothetical protein
MILFAECLVIAGMRVCYSVLSRRKGLYESWKGLKFVNASEIISSIIMHILFFYGKLSYLKVDHFSKYGLSDSDEEDVPVSNVKKFKPTKPLHQQPENSQIKQQQHRSDQQLLAKEVSHVETNFMGQATTWESDSHASGQEIHLNIHLVLPSGRFTLHFRMRLFMHLLPSLYIL